MKAILAHGAKQVQRAAGLSASQVSTNMMAPQRMHEAARHFEGAHWPHTVTTLQQNKPGVTRRVTPATLSRVLQGERVPPMDDLDKPGGTCHLLPPAVTYLSFKDCLSTVEA